MHLRRPRKPHEPQKWGPSYSARPLAGCIRREWEKSRMPRRRLNDVGEVPLRLENRTRRLRSCSFVIRCVSKGTNSMLRSPTGSEAVCGSIDQRVRCRNKQICTIWQRTEKLNWDFQELECKIVHTIALCEKASATIPRFPALRGKCRRFSPFRKIPNV